MTGPQRKAAAVWAAAAAVCLLIVVVRHGTAPAEPTAPYLPGPYPAETLPATTTANPSTAAPPLTPAPGPVSTSEEARPGPATTPAPDDREAVAVTATAFLHGWLLRGTWDERSDALKTVTTPEYRGQIMVIDPDRVGLPLGRTVTVDPAQVTVTEAGAATAPATVDGFAVVVHEVRTGTGWRVDSHGRG